VLRPPAGRAKHSLQFQMSSRSSHRTLLPVSPRRAVEPPVASQNASELLLETGDWRLETGDFLVVFAYPFRSARPVLLLPDRRPSFQLVNQVLTGRKRVGPMWR